jgi:hypothetical protein
VNALLALYAAPWSAIFALEAWQANLIASLLTLARLSFAGWVLAKTGRSPVWALIALVPFAELAGLWALAYARWPSVGDSQPRQG